MMRNVSGATDRKDFFFGVAAYVTRRSKPRENPASPGP